MLYHLDEHVKTPQDNAMAQGFSDNRVVLGGGRAAGQLEWDFSVEPLRKEYL